MPNKVTITPYFESRYKRFARKFVSLESEMDNLIENLTESPALGESLGQVYTKFAWLSGVKARVKVGAFEV